jgi:hypothetical protein
MANRLLLNLVLALTLAPLASTAQQLLSSSPDVTVSLGAANVVTSDEAIALDNQTGIVALESLGAIPSSADLIGYAELLGGTKLLSLDTTVALSGGVVARPGDVIAWNGATHSIYFDSTSAGIPRGVRTDAVAASAQGLLLSFDTDVSLPGGVVAADEDLVRWNGSSFSLVFDGSLANLDRALDVDGAQDLGGGQFLMSFDTTGSVDGITFGDEDVLRYANGAWSIEVDGSALDADWGPADLDAFQVPEPDGISMLAAGLLAIAGRGGLRARRARKRAPRSAGVVDS